MLVTDNKQSLTEMVSHQRIWAGDQGLAQTRNPETGSGNVYAIDNTAIPNV